jgi:recombination protein RecT
MTEIRKEGKLQDPTKIFQDALVKARLKRLLGQNKNFGRYLQLAVNDIRQNPKLMQCDPASILKSVENSATLGLEIGSLKGHAYLIPRYNSKLKKYICQLQTGYKGLEYLVHQAGIGAIETGFVYENDEFEIEYGLNPKLRHKPAFKNRGERLCVWALAIVNEKPIFRHLSMEYLKELQAKIPGANDEDSVWNKNFPGMAEKTVSKRLCEKLPKYLEEKNDYFKKLEHAVLLDNQTDEEILNDSLLQEDDYNDILDVTPNQPQSKANDILNQLGASEILEQMSYVN